MVRTFGWTAQGSDGEEYGTSVAVFLNDPPSYQEWLEGIDDLVLSVRRTSKVLEERDVTLNNVRSRLGPAVQRLGIKHDE